MFYTENYMTLFGILMGMAITLVVYSAYIFVIAFTLWMAVDAAKQDRFWWIVLIIGIPFVGSGVYFFTEKKHEYAKAESHHIHESETESQHESTPHKRKPRKHDAGLAEDTNKTVDNEVPVISEVEKKEKTEHETIKETDKETKQV